jgi:hypothetical protein
VGWPNFVYLPDWVGLDGHGGAVISGWWGIVEQVRPETKNPPARRFSGGGCLGFGSRTKVLHSVGPDKHTHAPRTPRTGPGALLCVQNHVHFCKRTLCARQVVFHGPFSFRPRWSESAPLSVLGVNVTVERMDLTEGEETAAICKRGSKNQEIPSSIFHFHSRCRGESSGSRLIVTGGWDGGDRLSVFYEFRAMEGFLTRREMRKS